MKGMIRIAIFPVYKNHMKRLLPVLLLISCAAYAQEISINPQWLNGFWNAKWIAHPTASSTQFGVFHFRKSINLTAKPSSFIIHVSADNRYRFFVNGQSVATGPARSDLNNWCFESVDIAPYLRAGNNVLAATVWNFAEYRPYSQISFQTAFIVQGNTAPEEIVNTNNSWKVVKDSAYEALPLDRAKLRTYIVIAEGEQVDGNKYSWGFESPDTDTSKWLPAMHLWYPAKTRTYGTDGNWMLVPSPIPMLEEKKERFELERRKQPASLSIQNLISNQQAVTIPANTKFVALIDNGHLTNAYPTIQLSSGKNAVISMSYAEALFDPKRVKGNRDSVEGKELIGIRDAFISDGGAARTYAPLYFRTYRYLQLEIETKDQPLVLTDIYSIFTAYPFKENARFKTDRKDLADIWNVGWRTARLCAMDTYVDCPYYEQLQYVGDTRIQALISLYVSGDDRLMKKAIDDISHSSIPDGLTQSRFPSRDLQVIPTFSLWWICMIHDYWMHKKDEVFVRSHLNRIEQVVGWYKDRMAANGMLGKLQWWQFVDWAWPRRNEVEVGGVPSGVKDGGSAIISLQFAYTLQRAAQIMDRFGKKDLALSYRTLAASVLAKTYALCWDSNKKLIADTYEKKEFSQHANILAILTDAVPATQQKDLLKNIIRDKSITQATYYFRFYLFEALKKVKLGDEFLEMLKPWQDMLDRGLTTFAEQNDPTRSDCHAWSASPNYEFLSLVCGIRPASAGFEKVLIEPALGNLTDIEASVPHPSGAITVKFNRKAEMLTGEIELPAGISGTLLWKGKQLPLKSGKQAISL
jgi:alpha-L-rhamnosidase